MRAHFYAAIAFAAITADQQSTTQAIRLSTRHSLVHSAQSDIVYNPFDMVLPELAAYASEDKKEGEEKKDEGGDKKDEGKDKKDGGDDKEKDGGKKDGDKKDGDKKDGDKKEGEGDKKEGGDKAKDDKAKDGDKDVEKDKDDGKPKEIFEAEESDHGVDDRDAKYVTEKSKSHSEFKIPGEKAEKGIEAFIYQLRKTDYQLIDNKSDAKKKDAADMNDKEKAEQKKLEKQKELEEKKEREEQKSEAKAKVVARAGDKEAEKKALQASIKSNAAIIKNEEAKNRNQIKTGTKDKTKLLVDHRNEQKANHAALINKIEGKEDGKDGAPPADGGPPADGDKKEDKKDEKKDEKKK